MAMRAVHETGIGDEGLVYLEDASPLFNKSQGCLGVMIVDHRRMVRSSLEALIDEQDDLEVVAHATSTNEALELLRGGRFNRIVILVDLESSDGHGMHLIRSVESEFPTCSVVGYGRGQDEPTVARAFYAGAEGFVDSNVDPADLIDAVRRSVDGEIVVKGISRHALPRLAEEIDKLRRGAPKLTERECEVLKIAAEGLAAQDIARRLDISVRTVTTHLSHIYSKLGVHSRVAAIAVASRAGYLTGDAPAN